MALSPIPLRAVPAPPGHVPDPGAVPVYLESSAQLADLPENTSGEVCVLVSDAAGNVSWVEKFTFLNDA